MVSSTGLRIIGGLRRLADLYGRRPQTVLLSYNLAIPRIMLSWRESVTMPGFLFDGHLLKPPNSGELGSKFI